MTDVACRMSREGEVWMASGRDARPRGLQRICEMANGRHVRRRSRRMRHSSRSAVEPVETSETRADTRCRAGIHGKSRVNEE